MRNPAVSLGWALIASTVVAHGDSIVVFNEIMYHPQTNEAALEWVELQNQQAVDVDLSGWTLSGAVEFQFAEGTVIRAGGFLVVASSPPSLPAPAGAPNILGPWLGRLGNDGDTLRVRDRNRRIIDEVRYEAEGDWPSGADGAGPSLARRKMNLSGANPANWRLSSNLGGTPGTENFPAGSVPPEVTVVFNEVAASTNTAFWLELVNRGTTEVSLDGFVIARFGGETNREFVLPAETLAPGAFRQVSKSQLGFGADSGDRLVLYAPGRQRVADAVVAKKTARGRWPDGSGAWWFPDDTTPGAPNAFTRHDELVINEIMYHPPQLSAAADALESWVEILNQSSNEVDLTGWRLDEGIDYRFAPSRHIAAGAYLVVAQDPERLRQIHPGLDVVGPFTNRLSKRSSYLVLKDPNNNPADEVRYYDGGAWPESADGGGSSLELRHPRADHSKAEAWAASDESAKSIWVTNTWRGVAQSASPLEPTLWHEFALCLLDGAGEVLLDDVRVTETPSTAPKQLLQNGSFHGGSAAHWRLLGNHRRSRVELEPGNPGNYVLHLIATGPGEYGGNQIETTLTNNVAIVNGREYEISYRARWLAGKSKLNARLYFNRLPRTYDLPRPLRLGTPGTVNSRSTTNLGPTFSDLSHSPVVPAVNQPVTVTVTAADPDGVSSMLLKYSRNGGVWQGLSMTSSAPASAQFRGVISGGAAAMVVQFYVEATDAHGAVASFPSGGSNSRALYVVQDNQATPSPGRNFRVVMTPTDAAFLHAGTNHQSNELLWATVIADEREVYYNVGVRLKGSFPSRDSARVGYHCSFNPDQLYRGVHPSVGIDRSRTFAVGDIGELIIRHIAHHAGGIPSPRDDAARFIAPLPAFTTMAEFRLAGYDADYLDGQFANGSEGPMFEIEGSRWSLATTDNNPESLKQPGNDFGGSDYANLDVQNYGDDKESYRWFLLAAHNRTDDDYPEAIAFSKLLSLTGSALDSRAPEVLDLDECLRVMAYLQLLGALDVYYSSVAVHNLRFYVRPEDRRVLLMPWDTDSAFLQSSSLSLFGTGNLAKLVNNPHHRRLYLNHMYDIVRTTFNTTYMLRWIAHYGTVGGRTFDDVLGYIGARASYVLSQLPTTTPFAITSNGGNNFSTDGPIVTLTGTAPIGVRSIEVNGVLYPVVWLGGSNWSVTVPMTTVTNLMIVRGLDNAGNSWAGAVDSITVTNAGLAAPSPVVINEWMAANQGPMGYADPLDGLYQDWLELFNPNSNAINLSGFTLTDNLAYPAKWRLPANTTIAARGYLLVWADGETNQNASAGNRDLHAAFQLSSGGDELGLFGPDGTLQHGVRFGTQLGNISQGLFPDGRTNTIFLMTNYTPRAANTLAGPCRFPEIRSNGGMVEFSWTALPGRSYRVQYADELNEPLWRTLSPELQATNDWLGWQDALPPGTSRRFYRVMRVER